MSKTKYTYAVARIRALEVSLLTNAVIEQLLACKSAEQALQLLVEKMCIRDRVAHRVNSNEQEDRRGDNYVKHCTL